LIVTCPGCKEEHNYNLQKYLDLVKCECGQRFVVDKSGVVYIPTRVHKNPTAAPMEFSPEVTREIKRYCKDNGIFLKDVAKELNINVGNFTTMLKNCRGNKRQVMKILDFYGKITAGVLIKDANC